MLAITKALTFKIGARQIRLNPAANLRLQSGTISFLTGPSGAGKTQVARRLADPQGPWWSTPPQVGLIHQEPASFSDPYTTVGSQVAEAVHTHNSPHSADRLQQQLGLGALGSAFATDLSAGQQQRLLVGLQLTRSLDVLIADEPTSALDPLNRATIIDLLLQAFAAGNPRALLIITHDLLVIRLAQQLWRTHNQKPFPALFYALEADREHPNRFDLAAQKSDPLAQGQRALWLPCSTYIRTLQNLPQKTELPRAIDQLSNRLRQESLSALWELTQQNPTPNTAKSPYPKTHILAQSFFYGAPHQSAGVDLSQNPMVLSQGQIAGLVGESGAGKTTLMRLAAGLLKPYRSLGWSRLKVQLSPTRPAWRRLQIVFQNPDTTTLNPTQTLGNLIAGLPARKRPGFARLAPFLLQKLGLPKKLLNRRPAALSGGEKYRFGLVLALINQPDFLILDEPFAAVDETTQAQIIRLCLALKQGTLGPRQAPYRGGTPMGILIISHQVEILFKICDQWHLLERPPGRPYSTCLWQGHPLETYDAYQQGDIRSPYLKQLIALTFEDQLPTL